MTSCCEMGKASQVRRFDVRVAFYIQRAAGFNLSYIYIFHFMMLCYSYKNGVASRHRTFWQKFLIKTTPSNTSLASMNYILKLETFLTNGMNVRAFIPCDEKHPIYLCIRGSWIIWWWVDISQLSKGSFFLKLIHNSKNYKTPENSFWICYTILKIQKENLRS